MVYCAQGELAFTSAGRRDAVLADIQSRVASRERWDADLLEAAVFRFGQNGLRLLVRFVLRADADALKSRVESFAAGQRLPVAGSWLAVHDCTHDEGTNSCVEVARRVW